MKERGFLHQVTDERALEKLLSELTSAYIGFDCTASSLHVGSLVQIMIFRWLKKLGHKPVILLGGGTTRVGDPSGKDEARQILTADAIEDNKRNIAKIFAQFDLGDVEIVDNADWLLNINYIEFLRDYGKHFSVNRMLTFDSVKLRLDRQQSLSFLEFNYMLLQAYDFVELYNRYGCRLQIGGSDQWGNIINGIELQRRLVVEEVQKLGNDKATEDKILRNSDKELFGLTTPLITTANGTKMGKTASGAVWLADERVSAYEYWQFWRNTDDKDVGRFLKLFTELPLSEINKLEALEGSDINEAKKILAFEATKICHGEEKAIQSAETARKLFEENKSSDNLPTIEISGDEFAEGIPAFMLFQKVNFAKSGGEARRLIKGGGGRINDKKVTDENMIISKDYLNDNNAIKVSSGKKKHVLVKII
jgi:tyrosyl-tRNA synthetase